VMIQAPAIAAPSCTYLAALTPHVCMVARHTVRGGVALAWLSTPAECRVSRSKSGRSIGSGSSVARTAAQSVQRG
jgi:hypothetical protein